MSERYIHDRFFPDKAIDILDEACSKINLNNKDFTGKVTFIDNIYLPLLATCSVCIFV